MPRRCAGYGACTWLARPMLRLTSACLIATASIGCATSDATSDATLDRDLELATAPPSIGATWTTSATLHAGEPVADHAAARERHVYPVWVAGSASAPVTFDVVATARAGDDVRAAVLGPLHAGARSVLAAGGYASPRADVELSVDAEDTGEYLVVVGSFELARATSYDLALHCDGCEPRRIDALAEPKAGALVGTADGRVVHAVLGAALAPRSAEVELAVLASPPGHPDAARVVATSRAAGDQLTAVLPADVAAGDDLRLVVRTLAGEPLDTGVVARFAPEATALARTDAVIYSDLGGVQIGGIAGFYEGVAELSLRSEPRHRELATATVRATLPGQPGNGLGAFDAVLAASGDGEGPRDGELVSIGVVGGGTGAYQRLGCFEYCNDLSGLATCTGGPRPCPAAGW